MRVIALLTAIKAHLPRYYAFVSIMAHAGLRPGEALGLKWQDIDFESRTIHVRLTYSKYRFSTPKGKRFRKVDMSASLAAILKSHRIEQAQETLSNGLPAPDFVTVNQESKPANLDNFRNREWKAAYKIANKGKNRIRLLPPKSLRHYYATERLMKGDDLWDVSNQPGHHDSKVTERIYAHWIPNTRSKAQVDEHGEALELPANDS